MKKIGLLGAGGQAKEIIEYCSNIKTTVAFLAVDKQYMSSASNFAQVIDISQPQDRHVRTPVIIAVGAPAIKRRLYKRWQGRSYATAIEPSAFVGSSVRLGDGCVVAPGAVLTANIVLGDHVFVNVLSSVGHDCRIGDFTTISPGVSIGGNVSIGEGVFIGIGAKILNGVTIANGCVIGAGSTVVNSITVENSVVVGLPGKTVKENEGWIEKI